MTESVDDPIDPFGPIQSPPDAEKLRHLISSINAAADSARTAWLAWLGAMAYLYIAVASVSHHDLLLDAPLKLPILGVEVPLTSFFWITPPAILLAHLGLLLNQATLIQRAAILDKDLAQWERYEGHSNDLRAEISSFYFAQIWIGPPTPKILNYFWRLIGQITVVITPILLLLFIQAKYLPYHDTSTTWFHRTSVLLDIVCLVVVGYIERLAWRLAGASITADSKLKRFLQINACVIGGSCITIFSLFVATIPDEGVDRLTSSLSWADTLVPYGSQQSDRLAFWPTAYFFEGDVNQVSGRAVSFFSRNLILSDIDFSKQKDERLKQPVILRGRDLRFAIFDRSILKGAEFTGTNLSHSRFVQANLANAVMTCADPGHAAIEALYGAPHPRGPDSISEKELLLAKYRPGCTDLSEANLEGASFERANLRGAKLSKARLNNTNFSNANLFYATLDGAMGWEADFHSANLALANLNSSNFTQANFEGAFLLWVEANGAKLEDASLMGADLREAKLIGANLNRSQLSGADLGGTDLRGATLIAASLIGANIVSGSAGTHQYSGYLPGYQSYFGGAEDFVSRLNLIDMRKVRISNTIAPKRFNENDRSLDLIDGAEAIIRPLADRDFEILRRAEKRIDFWFTERGIRKKIQPIIDSAQNDYPERQKAWVKLFDSTLRSESAEDKRSELLVKLVCDETKSEAVLEGLIGRADDYWYDGAELNGGDMIMRGPNFNPMPLYERVRDGRCPLYEDVSAQTISKFASIVQKYRRFKYTGTFQTRNEVYLIPVIPQEMNMIGDIGGEYSAQLGPVENENK